MRRPFLEITNDLSTVTEGDENLSADASGTFSTPRSKILPPKKTRISNSPAVGNQNLSANTSDALFGPTSDLLPANETRTNMSIQEGDENLTADVTGAFSPLRFNMAMAGDGTDPSVLQFSSGLEMTKEVMDNLEKNSIPWDSSVDVSAAFSPSKSHNLVPESEKESSLLQPNNSQSINSERTESLIQNTVPQNVSANISGLLSTSARNALMPEAELESSLLQYSTGLEITKEMMEKLEKNAAPWNTSASFSGAFSLLQADLPVAEMDPMESSVKLNVLETTKEKMEKSEQNVMSETPANLSSVIFTPRQKTLEEGELESSELQLNNSQRVTQDIMDGLEQNTVPQNTSLNVSGVLSTSTRKVPTPEARELESSELQLNNSHRVTQDIMEGLEQNTSLDVSGVLSTSIRRIPTPEARELESSGLQLNSSQRITQDIMEGLEQNTVPQNASLNASGVLSTSIRRIPTPEAGELECSGLQLNSSQRATQNIMDGLEQNSALNASNVLSTSLRIPTPEDRELESSGLQLNSSQRVTQEMTEELQDTIPQNTSLNTSNVLSTSHRVPTPEADKLESSRLQLTNDEEEVNKEMENMEQDPVPQNMSINSSVIFSTSVNKIPTPELDRMVSSLLESGNDQEGDQEMGENVEQNAMSLNTSANVSGILNTSTPMIPTPEVERMESSLLQSENVQQGDQEMTENIEENPMSLNLSVNVSNVLSTSISKLPMQEEFETTALLLQPNNDQEMTENFKEDALQNKSANISGVLSTSACNPIMPEPEIESAFQFSNGLEMTKDMMENLEKNSAVWNTSGGFMSLRSDVLTEELNGTESSFLRMNSAPEMNQGVSESEQDIMSVKTPVDFSCMIPTPQNISEENEAESSILQANNSQTINQENMQQNTSTNFSEMFSNSGFRAPMSENELESSLLQLNHGLEISKRMAEILGKGVSTLNMSTTMSQTLGNQSNIFMTEKDEMNFLLLEARCAHEASKELCEKLKYELTSMKNEYSEMKDLSEKLQVENFEAKKEIANLNATILEGKKKYNQMKKEFTEKEDFLNEELKQREEKYAELEVEKDSLISKGKKKLEDLRQENDFLSTEIEELKENLKNLETENEKFKEMYCNSERELKETSEKLRMTESKLGEFESHIAGFEEEKQKLNEMHCNNERELNEKLRTAEIKLEEFERNITVFEEEKQKLNEAYGDLEREKATLSEKLENYEILIDELKKTLKLAEEETKRWKDLKSESEEKVRAYDSRIETLQDKIISIEEENQKLKLENEEKLASNYRVEELESKITSMEEENQKLKDENEEKLRVSNSRTEELQNKLTLIEEENQKLKASNSRIEELQSKLTMIEEENKQLQSENEEKLKASNSRSEELQNKLILIEEENQKLQSESEEKVKTSNSRIEELQSKLTTVEEENQKLQLEKEERLRTSDSRIEELQNKLAAIEEENQKLTEGGKEVTEIAGKLKVAELRITSLEKKVKEYEDTIDDLEETQRLNSDTIFSLTKQNTQLKEKLGMSGIRAIIEMDCSSHSVNEDKEQSFTSAKEYPSPKTLENSTMTDGQSEKEGTPNTPGRKPSFASKLASPFRKNKQAQNPNSTCNQQ